MPLSFLPDLDPPPPINANDFLPSIDWGEIKHGLVYKEDGKTRVEVFSTSEEFEVKNLSITFGNKCEIVHSWSFNGYD